MSLQRKIPRRLYRQNLATFLGFVFPLLGTGEELRCDPYLLAMCFALEQLALGKRRRQIVALPPRSLKSIMAVVLSAWMMGRDPTTKILVVSYGGELADKQTRLFRRIIEDPRFSELFPRFAIKRNSMVELETTLGGFRKSVTPTGAATGFGANLIIIDDLLKAGEAYSDTQREAANTFFDATLYQRLNNKVAGAVLVIAQRLHEFDIIGHLQTKCEWDEFICPAIAVEEQSFPSYWGSSWVRQPGDLLASLYSADDLAEIRHMSGEWIWSTQHQQNPIPPGGNCVKRDWFGEYEAAGRDGCEYVVQSWDTATSNDPSACFSVCLTLGYMEDRWCLLDVYRRQVNMPDLRDAAINLFRNWRPNKVLIEDASSGRQLFQLLREKLGTRREVLRACRPFGSKEERLALEAHKIEQGLIALPTSGSWLAGFEAEMLGFPHTRYNDQVDALCQFLRWVDGKGGRSMLNTDPWTGRRKPGTRPKGSFSRQSMPLMGAVR